MGTTKYIINNLSAQTINGNLTLSGNSDFILSIRQTNESPWGFGIYNETYNPNQVVLGGFVWNDGRSAIGTEVGTSLEFYNNADYLNPSMTITTSGVTVKNILTSDTIITNNVKDNNIGRYKALLTQTGSIVGSDISFFAGSLIIGEEYTITDYQPGDDFSNIANVTSGTTNSTGCVFLSTGEIPANWENGSTLTSNGALIVNEIENTLGFNITWVQVIDIADGFYVGYNSSTNTLVQNSFPKSDTYITTVPNQSPIYGAVSNDIFSYVASISGLNDAVVVSAFDRFYGSTNNLLYYSPVEITIKKKTIQCTGIDNFPFNYVAINLFFDGISANVYLTNSPTLVYSNSDIVDLLNESFNTQHLGTFSENGLGGIILTMSDYSKNYLYNGTITFTIFAD